MPATLLSTQVPALIGAGALINTTVVAPASPALAQIASEGQTGVDKINRAFKHVDAGAQLAGGGGACRVLRGLALATAANLSLPVTAGQAALDGLATVPANTTHALELSIARAHVWLSQAGVLSHVNNSLTPPGASGYVYLGSAVTSPTAITSVDESGVPRMRGGLLYVQTADLGPPAWVVPANVYYLHQTLAGLYLYIDGTFRRVGSGILPLEGWYYNNPGTGLTAQAFSRFAGDGFPGVFIAPRAGHLVSVWVKTNDARTAGTATVEVYKNGVATGLTAVLNGTNATFKATSQNEGLDTFAAGDELDLRLTTDGSWAPVTGDLRAGIEVTF